MQISSLYVAICDFDFNFYELFRLFGVEIIFIDCRHSCSVTQNEA